MADSIGRKDDAGKPRWSLVPPGVFRTVVAVLEHGAREYGAWNWLHVENPRQRYYDAIMRHLDAWWCDGEWLDRKSNLPHLAHVIASCLFLLALAPVKKAGFPEHKEAA